MSASGTAACFQGHRRERGVSIHIETEPSDYRISLHVVGVADTTDVGAGLEIYVEGSALNDPARREARRIADKELLYMQAAGDANRASALVDKAHACLAQRDWHKQPDAITLADVLRER